MHAWRFFTAGGFDQVSLERGADFASLAELDQKLWAALGCPTDGLEFDAATLALIDADGDGRIRASELIAAVEWAVARLASPDELLAGGAGLPLASISTASPAAAAIAAAARALAQDGVVALEAAEAASSQLAAQPLNGDGVVTVASGSDTAALVQAMLDTGFGVADRSGAPGVDAAQADAWFAAAGKWLDWQSEAEANGAALLPAGNGTAAAWAAVTALRAKIDDYFTRCRLVRFDARAATALNREESAWLALAARDLEISAAEIRAFPLAHVGPDARLDLDAAVNPAWHEAVAVLRSAAITPLLGERSSLGEADWQRLLALLAPYADWQARKPAPAFDAIDGATLAALLAPASRDALAALLAADAARAGEYDALADLVRLVRYRRDLATLCRNFVNLADFYDPARQAIFQCGTLYLDQRSCTLCLPVHDAGRHAQLAGMAGAYLAYCDCVRRGSGEKMQIVAAFTGGDSDNLLVGRNGVFYDRTGRDWDATITRIVDNPISIRQAFWAPYKKLARFIEQQVAKRASAADAAGEQKLQSTVVMVAETPAADKAAPPAPARKIDVGTVAALGVALGSIGTAFGYFLRTIAEVKAWQLPLLALGIMLAISGPAIIMAFLKLRRRNLAPLLDANGWAVNARALVSVPFGASLTGVAALPPGASSAVADRFAPGAGWSRIVLAVFLLWWAWAFLSDQGYLAAWFGAS